MGLVKTYQRYSIISQFGVVGSSRANIVLLESGKARPKSTSNENVQHLAVAAANEDVNIWDIRRGELVRSINSYLTSFLLYLFWQICLSIYRERWFDCVLNC